MCDKDVNGIIFDIQHFSVSDGPGIRTTVFLKGCPLRCRWCHNPESYAQRTQILTHFEKCMMCGACVTVCSNGCHTVTDRHEFNSASCNLCCECAKMCPNYAITVTGRCVKASAVMEEVMEDSVFYRTSGGGLTISGGEPMMQPEFALALTKSAKKYGLHVCVETSGFCDFKHLSAIAPYVDIFLFDYKCADSEKHKMYIGVPNENILKNLFALDKSGAKTVLRCPIIPYANMFDWHFEGIIQTASRLKNITGIDLEPYHNIGVSKRASLGMPAKNEDVPDMETLNKYAKEIEIATQIKTKVM